MPPTASLRLVTVTLVPLTVGSGFTSMGSCKVPVSLQSIKLSGIVTEGFEQFLGETK